MAAAHALFISETEKQPVREVQLILWNCQTMLISVMQSSGLINGWSLTADFPCAYSIIRLSDGQGREKHGHETRIIVK